MQALRFTARGAVPLPDTLQVRVGAEFRGRVPVGARQPGRSLGLAEVVRNVEHFTTAGPRRRAVRTLVLSGVGGGDPVLPGIEGFRARGLERVVIHAEPDRAAACVPFADQVAVAVRDPEDLAPLVGLPRLVLTVPLEGPVLGRLAGLLAAIRAVGPDRVVLAWPFPAEGAPPARPAGEVVGAIGSCAAELSGLPFAVKGLPACLLGPLRRQVPDLAERTGRTRNRWYVDADHQLDQALLFLPDVLRFTKGESCRFCELDSRCDGVAEAWWRLGLAGPLLPLGEGEPRAG